MTQQYQVDGFSIYPESNQIISEQGTFNVEPQTMAVLVVLLNHQGEVVFRDKLIELAWRGAVVSDSSVNRTIAQLRKVFGDSAKDSVYIETIAKKGYRFKQQASLSKEIDSKPHRTHFILIVNSVLALIAIGLVSVGWLQTKLLVNSKNISNFVLSTQLTNEVGSEGEPYFSSDGQFLVYTTKNNEELHTSISLTRLSDGRIWRLNSIKEQQFYSPIFSPDNLSITFTSVVKGQCSVSKVDIQVFKKGVFHGNQLAECNPLYPPSTLRWRTSSELLIAEKASKSSPYQINQLDIKSGKKTQITFPKSNSWGDRIFDYNMASNKLAVIRWSPSIQEIFVLDLKNSKKRQIRVKQWGVKAVSLNSDGSQLLLSWKNQLSIIELLLNQQQPVLFDKNINYATFTDSGRTIAVVKKSSRSHIWQAQLGKSQREKLTYSDAIDFSPIYLDETNQIAFISNRSGMNQVWTMDRQGHNKKMVSSFESSLSLSSLSWSAATQQLIAWESKQHQIWQIDLSNSNTKLIFTSDNQMVFPQLSSNGQLITFGSLKSGDWEVWAINAVGKELNRMTFSGGYFGKFDEVSQSLVFTRHNDKGVWRRRMLLGDSEQIVKSQTTEHYPWWAMESNLIYLAQDQGSIYEYSLNGELVEQVHSSTKPLLHRFDIDNTTKQLIGHQYETSEGAIWLYRQKH